MKKFIKIFLISIGSAFLNYLFVRNFPNADYPLLENSYLENKIGYSLAVILMITGFLFIVYSAFKREEAAAYFRDQDEKICLKISSNSWQKIIGWIMWCFTFLGCYQLNKNPWINDHIYLLVKGWLITALYPFSLFILGTAVFLGNIYFIYWTLDYRILDYIIPYSIMMIPYKMEILFCRIPLLQGKKKKRLKKSEVFLKWKISYYTEQMIFQPEKREELKKRIKTAGDYYMKIISEEEAYFFTETIYEMLEIEYASSCKDKYSEAYFKSKNSKREDYFNIIEAELKEKGLKKIPYILRKYYIHYERGHNEYCTNLLNEIFSIKPDFLRSTCGDIDERILQSVVRYSNRVMNWEKKNA